MKFRGQLDPSCSHAAARFTKLYLKRLLDNLIPLGDMLRPFLCQFSPSYSSLLFLPAAPQCRIVFYWFFFFSCSLISFLSMAATPQNPSDSMQFMQMMSLSCSGWMRPQQNLFPLSLSLSLSHTHTHGLRMYSGIIVLFYFSVCFLIWNPLHDCTTLGGRNEVEPVEERKMSKCVCVCVCVCVEVQVKSVAWMQGCTQKVRSLVVE